ncbi:serine/arginine repetitive matrix protein 2 [Rhinatrema bivittatum]|uniref:serine/arginine repetitive matrix protein 2 n=1 Tax=Rhinatrema bivittatum TaxID=194408 RepID=UPI00112D2922|nr:serine/arginine repetitive matrix protein 2 [Rhinatrema bivittatum]XP_029462642.1 serine/arginine repetitive matrix protein 2 [Rhinatrema bivittatum]
MYNGIGLPTPRGSGTNGYVQRNLSALRHKKDRTDYKSEEELRKLDSLMVKKPNQEILDHERKRKVELKCLELEEMMEEQGYAEEEIQEKVATFRQMLLEKDLALAKEQETQKMNVLETHQLAEANEKKNERLRAAFGISENYVDGSSFDPSRRAKEEATVVTQQQEPKHSLAEDLGSSRSPSRSPVKQKKKKKKKDRGRSVSSSPPRKEKKKSSKKSKHRSESESKKRKHSSPSPKSKHKAKEKKRRRSRSTSLPQKKQHDRSSSSSSSSSSDNSRSRSRSSSTGLRAPVQQQGKKTEPEHAHSRRSRSPKLSHASPREDKDKREKPSKQSRETRRESSSLSPERDIKTHAQDGQIVSTKEQALHPEWQVQTQRPMSPSRNRDSPCYIQQKRNQDRTPEQKSPSKERQLSSVTGRSSPATGKPLEDAGSSLQKDRFSPEHRKFSPQNEKLLQKTVWSRSSPEAKSPLGRSLAPSTEWRSSSIDGVSLDRSESPETNQRIFPRERDFFIR